MGFLCAHFLFLVLPLQVPPRAHTPHVQRQQRHHRHHRPHRGPRSLHRPTLRRHGQVRPPPIWDMTLSLPKNEHTPADVLVSPTDLSGSPMWVEKVHCPLGHERLVIARACEQCRASSPRQPHLSHELLHSSSQLRENARHEREIVPFSHFPLPTHTHYASSRR